jgi:hypothetical protein
MDLHRRHFVDEVPGRHPRQVTDQSLCGTPCSQKDWVIEYSKTFREKSWGFLERKFSGFLCRVCRQLQSFQGC